MNEDRVSVLRLVEIEGPRSWVEATMKRSIHGTFHLSPNRRITSAVLDTCPLALPEDIKHALDEARAQELVNG